MIKDIKITKIFECLRSWGIYPFFLPRMNLVPVRIPQPLQKNFDKKTMWKEVERRSGRII
ncbi:MAG TPA: hypothetical protein DD723_03525 [Candidatus Omnitrophica bacterium]|nr:MAG: hypothetical protein A2Z81_00750 [Omnitrophica WOR_2 bacterium GWA2_45_18]OGX19711.1 MAG: hypothetical protein A2Y04_01680 [Omnitrophica WOR_2 bacterium GWC2_45_7]HBR14601.1 hypothetical protein [Candidatus Omnitrophota bacterium]